MRIPRTKRTYIDNLSIVLEARPDFKDLNYYRDNVSNKEYLTLSSLIGHTWTFDITGYTDAQIFHLIAMIDCAKPGDPEPKCLIRDSAELLRLGRMFAE